MNHNSKIKSEDYKTVDYYENVDIFHTCDFLSNSSDLVCHNFDFLSYSSDLVCHNFDRLCHNYDLAYLNFD